MLTDRAQEFLSLFRDPLYVAIPRSKGTPLLHTRDIDRVLALNANADGFGAYFTVNGFAKFVEGEFTGRTKENVTTFNCNFLDIDLTPETRRTQADFIYKELCDKGLQPTAVVLTGKGLHVYWLYKEPYYYGENKLKEYEVLQTAIVEHYKGRGSDMQARDAARVLRIPGARYFDKEGNYTCDIELLYLNPQSKYTAIEIAKYFQATVKIETKEGEQLMRLGDDFNLASIINVKKGTRHHDAFAAAMSIIQRTKDLSSARRFFQSILSTWESPKSDPLDWKDAWAQFENAKREIEKEKPQAFLGDPEALNLAITSFDDIEEVPLAWLWEGMIAKGKPHMLTGDPGLGKSQVTIDIAAKLSNGTAFPSYTLAGGAKQEPIGTVILSAEDDAADTIKPRLRAAGADMKYIVSLSSAIIQKEKGGKLNMRSLALREDAEQILKAIQTLPFKIGLVIIDPISAFLSGSQDSNSNSDARGTLAQLQHTIMSKGIALLMINHNNKNTSAKSAHTRSMGSVGWNAAARATFYVFQDETDEDKRVFSVGKMNLAKGNGKGFFFTVKSKDMDIAGVVQSVPYIEWNTSAFPQKTADEYASMPVKKKQMASDDCLSELELYMVGKTSVPSKEGLKYMKERGYSQAEVYRAARKLKIIGEYGIWQTPT